AFVVDHEVELEVGPVGRHSVENLLEVVGQSHGRSLDDQIARSTRRKTLKPMISAASTLHTALSHGGLASDPISSRSRANRSSATGATGIPNESPTWLRTRASVGLNPSARTSSAGASVIARRTKIGIRRRMKPCITTCPAIVPTDEEANPEAIRATPKIVAAPPDTRVWRPS